VTGPICTTIIILGNVTPYLTLGNATSFVLPSQSTYHSCLNCLPPIASIFVLSCVVGREIESVRDRSVSSACSSIRSILLDFVVPSRHPLPLWCLGPESFPPVSRSLPASPIKRINWDHAHGSSLAQHARTSIHTQIHTYIHTPPHRPLRSPNNGYREDSISVLSRLS
jgi:hypothetical protein